MHKKLTSEVETVLSADSILSLKDVKTSDDSSKSGSLSEYKDTSNQNLSPSSLPKPITYQYLSLHLK